MRKWMPPVALGLAFALLGGALSPIHPAFGYLGAALASASWLSALVLVLRDRRGKYDLGRLREIHEREAIGVGEDEAVEGFDSVFCLCCQEPYDARFTVCPRCGRSQ